MVSTDTQPLYVVSTLYSHPVLKQYIDFFAKHLVRYHAAVLGIAGLFVAAGLVVALKLSALAGAVLIIGAFAGVIVRYSVDYGRKAKAVAHSPLLGRTITFTFYENIFVSDNAGEIRQRSYQGVKRIDEQQDFFYITVEDGGCIILSRQAYGGDFAEFVRSLTNRKGAPSL